jgi:predicted nicotinamide N-methyase
MSEEPPLAIHEFRFGETSLSVECRKALDQTINFRLTVQCDHMDIWESLRDFGGGFPESSDDEAVDAPPAAPAAPQEEPDKPDLLGLDVWPAALELCNYLAAHPSLVSSAAVLELGAGVGLPGLLAARLGAFRVVLTDYEPQVVAHVARNAALCSVAATVSGLCLDWTKLDALPPIHAHAYPLLLAADVLYIADIMPGFVAAVTALLAPGGVAIVGHQTRRALVLDETGTPEMVDVDVAFGRFKELCAAAGLAMRELGRRESPGFPGPLIMFALAGKEAAMAGLPPAFSSEAAAAEVDE